MPENNDLLDQLEQLLHFKKSKKFYAERLGITEEEINELYKELKGKNTGEEPKHTKNPAKILILDIETSPIMAYVWQTQVWKARIGHKQLINNWFMIS